MVPEQQQKPRRGGHEVGIGMDVRRCGVRDHRVAAVPLIFWSAAKFFPYRTLCPRAKQTAPTLAFFLIAPVLALPSTGGLGATSSSCVDSWPHTSVRTFAHSSISARPIPF